jgi:SAM-dependent methyltransferase
MEDRLTSNSYWNTYYEKSPEEARTIVKICGAYDWFWEKGIQCCSDYPKSVLEVGAFPGRYLAYLGSRYKLKVTGIDFNPDEGKFHRTLKALDVEGKYHCVDFFDFRTDEQFDLVLSNGFVEHFVNYDEVLDRHAKLVRPGGVLLLMIPNKRFLRSVYGNLVDRANQRVHNLKCMRLSAFRDFAARNSLSIEYLSYYGGFPYRVHQSLSPAQKMIYYPTRMIAVRINPWLAKFPNRFWSGTIVGIFKRPSI